MSLLCPSCKQPYLRVTASRDIDPGQNYDERAIQVLICSSCGYTGIGIYEESRRGALDSESFNHISYNSPIEKVYLLQKLIKRRSSIDKNFFIKSDEDGKNYKSSYITYVSSR